MRALIIDDHAALKITANGLNLIEGLDLTIALSMKEGLRYLAESPRFDRLYLDYYIGDDLGTFVLNWLSHHMEKVPEVIRSVSSGAPTKFQQMIDALLITVKRERIA